MALPKLQAAQVLRGKKLRVTKERVALLTLLDRARNPMSAGELASRKGAGMDPVTVYRGLETLADAGLVSRINLRHGHTDYELAETHHHHLVCTDCGAVEEFEWCPDDRSILRHSTQFTRVNEHALELFGVCNSCS